MGDAVTSDGQVAREELEGRLEEFVEALRQVAVTVGNFEPTHQATLLTRMWVPATYLAVFPGHGEPRARLMVNGADQ